MFNETSQYLDDIFTIDNPKFEKYIPDIYPAGLQLNKANTSDKETSFLDLNIKVIGNNETSQYLDDIFTIDNPKFEKYIPDIYPAGLQLNKANTSWKGLNIFSKGSGRLLSWI